MAAILALVLVGGLRANQLCIRKKCTISAYKPVKGLLSLQPFLG